MKLDVKKTPFNIQMKIVLLQVLGNNTYTRFTLKMKLMH